MWGSMPCMIGIGLLPYKEVVSFPCVKDISTVGKSQDDMKKSQCTF